MCINIKLFVYFGKLFWYFIIPFCLPDFEANSCEWSPTNTLESSTSKSKWKSFYNSLFSLFCKICRWIHFVSFWNRVYVTVSVPILVSRQTNLNNLNSNLESETLLWAFAILGTLSNVTERKSDCRRQRDAFNFRDCTASCQHIGYFSLKVQTGNWLQL